MQWMRSLDTQNIDTFVSKTAYGNVPTQGEGIDLRIEMHNILYGSSNPYTLPKGHWIIYRRYNRSVKSANYSNRTHEGIGGPGYTYSDELIRVRRVPTDKSGLPLIETKAGFEIGDKYIYYMEYTVVPKIGDHIFELNLADHTNTPSAPFSMKDKYIIKRVHDYRLENGNVQYFVVSCDYDEVRY